MIGHFTVGRNLHE